MPDAAGRLWRVADSWCGDAILALVIVMTLLSFDTATGLLSDARGQLGVACAAGVCGCLIVRRAHPSMATAVAAVLLGVMGATGSGSGQPFTALFVAVFALAYSLGADGRLAHSGPVLLLLIAGVQLAVGQFNPFPFVAMVTAGPWAAGLVVRSRRQLTEQLTARGGELEAERELFAAESVRYERARIARELHDIVAHCVSVMVIQASAGQRLTATDPSLAAAERAGRRIRSQLRHRAPRHRHPARKRTRPQRPRQRHIRHRPVVTASYGQLESQRLPR